MSNRISGSLSSEQVTAIKANIQALKDSLPILREFSGAEITAMPKLGGRTLEFVQAALEGGVALEGYLARNFDVSEFQRDLQTFQDLVSIRLTLEPIWRQLDNTVVAVGSDALEAALEVYATLKRAPQGSGAEVYVDAMAKRWRQARGNASDAAEASSDAQPAASASAAVPVS